ncbi:MAG TPA: c-type cytochrome [Novosphingobium sp.]|nr:c-type cytochrome [Novosphingobium sp.]
MIRLNGRVAAIAASALLFATLLSTGGATAQTAPAAAAPPAASPGSGPDSWAAFSGWKRYHGNCSTCHGPDGLGGTFAPSLVDSLKTLDHDQFLATVVNGKKDKNLTMPAFGVDPNVMCYVEDIYTYLKLRSDGKMDRGRPANTPTKPKDVAEAETACMGV